MNLWWICLHYRFHGAGGGHKEWIYCGSWKPTLRDAEEMAYAKADLICGPGGWSCIETVLPQDAVPIDVVRAKATEVRNTLLNLNQTLKELESS